VRSPFCDFDAFADRSGRWGRVPAPLAVLTDAPDRGACSPMLSTQRAALTPDFTRLWCWLKCTQKSAMRQNELPVELPRARSGFSVCGTYRQVYRGKRDGDQMTAEGYFREWHMAFQRPCHGGFNGRLYRSRFLAVAEPARGLGTSRRCSRSLGMHAPRGPMASGTGSQR
jgi:hypothetical protein